MSDKRLMDVEVEKKNALAEVDKTYGDMANKSDKYYQDQINASKDWANKQTQLQQEQTDFAIERIEQQKEQAQKDYTREQSGAYVDWQKESNKYGANAEMMASGGFANSGYSESSQVSMYNTYQNRVASARESYNQAVLNYNNMIKDAQLQNNSKLAEIAYQALQQQLELSLQGFQYHNQLVMEQLNKKMETEQMYHNRYQDVLSQINQEKALAEEIRQFNLSLAEEKRQFNALHSGNSSGGDSNNQPVAIAKEGTNKYGNSEATIKKAGDNYYFSNGYQPRYVNNMALAKTGDSIVVNGKTQNIWQTHDGTLWYWDGSSRTYKKTSRPKSSSKSGGATAFGLAQIRTASKE